MSTENAQRIYNTVTQSRDIAGFGDITFYGKTITLPGDQKATVLFKRSAVSKKILSLIAPQKLRKEKELAFDAITEAVKTKFPNTDGSMVLNRLGLRRGESIKLSKFRGTSVENGFKETVNKLHNAINARDIHANSSNSKNHFDQWLLQKTPGLDAVTKLSGEDLSLFSAKLPDVKSFKEFVRSALDSTAPKTGDSPNDQKAILNFISGWCQMNENERSTLKSSLSVDGQAAFEAISTLVNKMISVDKLPVNQSGSFGLDRSFADSVEFVRERKAIKQTLLNHSSGTNATDTTANLLDAARVLGASLGEKWRDTRKGPSNYMGLESQRKAEIRSFLDQNMQVVFAAIPATQRPAAKAEWLLNQEAFISMMAIAVNVAFSNYNISDIKNNQITIGNKRYDIGTEIGDGGEGIVRLAETTNGEKIAVKSTLPSPTNPSSLITEIDRHLLASSVTKNENILAFQGAFIDGDGVLSMAMEFAPHGDLANIFKRFGPDERLAFIARDLKNQEKLQNLDRYVATSLFNGLTALHEGAHMLHGDLKAANVFIGANGVPKLGDFGRSVLLEENIVKGATADAMRQLAPEVAVNLNNYFEMTSGADVWSIGIIIYEMKIGDPFPLKLPEKNKGGLNVEVQSRLTEFKNDPTMLDDQARANALKLDVISDRPLADLLLKIFHPDPNQRPTASQALAALNAMAGPTPPDAAEQGKLLMELSQWPINNSQK